MKTSADTPELSFTKHFQDNWVRRVGSWPTPLAVTDLIYRSVRIQPCRDMRLPDGTPYRVLAIYWHPELDLIIKVDTIENCAVTVMSRSCWRYDGEPRAVDKPAPGDCSRVACRACRPRVAPMHRPMVEDLDLRAERIARDFGARRKA